jgi:hypothetical protein
MNELSEFFSSVAKEKKRVEEEKIRFTPRVNVDLSDLSSFFGTITEAKREHVVIAKRDSTKIDALKGFFDRLDKFETALQENIDKQKEEPKDGFDPAEVEGYEEFNSNYDKKETEKLIDKSIEDTIKEKTESETLQDQLEPIIENKVEQVEIKPVNYFQINKRPEPKVEETDVNSIAQAMSGLIKKPEHLSDLEKLQREFTQFRKLVTMQMASIGGGGEVRLLNLDDVDTSSLGNGKFLVYNGTTQKLEFTDQVDGN